MEGEIWHQSLCPIWPILPDCGKIPWGTVFTFPQKTAGHLFDNGLLIHSPDSLGRENFSLGGYAKIESRVKPDLWGDNRFHGTKWGDISVGLFTCSTLKHTRKTWLSQTGQFLRADIVCTHSDCDSWFGSSKLFSKAMRLLTFQENRQQSYNKGHYPASQLSG